MDRFWSKVDASGDCWEWTAGINDSGYGTFWDGEHKVRAHRFAYELLVAPIPPGLEIDHLCRVRHCVNPDHLEPVTCRENLRRGINNNRQKTHCPHGHAYDASNIYWNSVGARVCRTCTLRACRERVVLRNG